MANLTSTLTVRLLDKVSGPAAAASRAILGIGNATTAANARGGMAALGTTMTAMASAVDKAANRMRAAAASMSGISFPLLFGAGFAARTVYEFEKVANTVEAVTNITKAQRDQLQSYAQSLNSLFPFSNTQIMQSALELGRAGLNFDQIMGALKGTLNLALAGNIELRESSDIATNVLTAMRLPMRTTEQVAASLTRVNDVLAFAANQSNIDVRQLGETFKYVGPMAAAAGMSVEQVAAAAMVMGNNGIRASEAGVAMRSALVRMVRPTSFMQASLARMNIDIRDFVRGGRQIASSDIVSSLAASGIDARPFAAQIDRVLKDPAMQRSLSAMTRELTNILAGSGGAMDRDKLAELIGDSLTAAGSHVDLFGFVRALQEKGADLGEIARIFDARQGARLITLLAGFRDLGTFLRRLEGEARGSTDRAARIMQQGVVGAWTRFTAAWENLAQAIARSGVLDTVTGMLNRFSGAIEALAKTNPAWLEFGTYAAIIAAAAPGVAIVGASIATIVGWLLRLGAFAGGGAATAAGAAAAAGAGAAARGGLMRGLLGRLGVAGAGLTALDLADPDGNLWGLTRPVDQWMMDRFGFNPSNPGGPAELSPEELTRRMFPPVGRQRGLIDDAPAPLPSLDGLLDRIQAENAGRTAAMGFAGGVGGELERTLPGIIQRALEAATRNLTISPTLRVEPRIDSGALGGIHGDIGVGAAR